MAESSDNTTNDSCNTGVKVSDSCSDEHDKVREDAIARTPRNPYRKVIVEKRPRSQSSNDSDKENKRQCVNSDNLHEDSEISTDGELSPLYQNQMSDPRVQALVWQQEMENIDEGNCKSFYLEIINQINLIKKLICFMCLFK